jgi:hypothetical protein
VKKTTLLKVALLVISTLSFTNVTAQKNIETQSLLWMRYHLTLKFNDNYQLRQEIEERTYWFPWRQHQFVARTNLERKLGKGWNTALGFTYFVHSLPHDPNVEEYTNQTELRPQFEFAYLQKLNDKLNLHHRYRDEFRFFEQPDGSFKYTNNRFRYKLELQYSPSAKIALKAFDEIHLNIGNEIVNNVFDQNRYGGGIRYMPLKNFGVELDYMNWFQQRQSGVDFYNRHIVRFTINHIIDFSKPNNQ